MYFALRTRLLSNPVLELLGSFLLLTFSAASAAVGGGTWSTTGSMTAARFFHTATLLTDGTVLVAGGCQTLDNCDEIAGAEIYHPTTGTWSATGTMSIARGYHTATLLTDGRVLVAGGFLLASAELYDPTTGTWSATGSMSVTRAGHTATLLTDGTVLVAGGAVGGDPASAELYDPTTGTWSATGSMTAARFFHTAATLLKDGTVLVAGGCQDLDCLGIASAEIYHPTTGTWGLSRSLLNLGERGGRKFILTVLDRVNTESTMLWGVSR